MRSTNLPAIPIFPGGPMGLGGETAIYVSCPFSLPFVMLRHLFEILVECCQDVITELVLVVLIDEA
jgi:hypothetical protein